MRGKKIITFIFLSFLLVLTSCKDKECKHESTTWIVDKEASCEHEGIIHKECNTCHKILSEESIKALGHDLIHYEGKEATCYESGYKAYDICERCNYTTYEEITSKNHNYLNYVCTSCFESSEENLIFELLEDDSGYCVVGLNNSNSQIKKIVIPNEYQGKPVVAIDLSALSNCYNLSNLEISNNIIELTVDLPSSLFYNEYDNGYYLGSSSNPYLVLISTNNKNIKNIEINENTKIIYDKAFYSCKELKKVIIPNNVVCINKQAFAYCNSLNDIKIPNSVKSIGRLAFAYCNSLTEIEIPNSVISYVDSILYECNSLTSVTIPFVGSSLNNAVYPSFGIIFGSSSNGRVPSSLKEVKVTGGTSVGKNAFKGCSDLTNIEIPNSVTSIEEKAYYGCTSLTSMEIPSSVISIGEYAFSGCTSLTKIEIPNSVISIGEYAFDNCSNLKNIIVNEKNSVYKSIDGNLYSKDEKTLIQYAIGKKESGFNIPNSVTSINIQAFFECKNLTSIKIPLSMTSIEECQFYNCSGLKSIIIPSSVTSIGSLAFYNCTSLTSIEIPSSVTTIGNSAFVSCSNLENVYYDGTIEDWCNIIFGDEDSNPMLYANHFCMKDTSKKYQEVTEVEISNNVTKIGNFQFCGFNNLIKITIPNSVTNIGFYAFKNCSSLTIYCEALSNPISWDSSWNPHDCTIIWNYKNRYFYKINYVLDDCILPSNAPRNYETGVGVTLVDAIPNNPNYAFLYWMDESGNKIKTINGNKDITVTAVCGIPKQYEPLWVRNQIGFDGKGMTYEIKVNDTKESDPFNLKYNGSDQTTKQEHQSLVSAAYNINILYSGYNDLAPWGPERVRWINNAYLYNELGNTYAVEIYSVWIPTLVKGESIVELYNMNNDTGFFTTLSSKDEDGYQQDNLVNLATAVKGKVYGYKTGVARPDYFMYYNVDKVKELGLEDPAELWMKGEWSMSYFETWVKNAQTKLGSGEYVLDMGYAESIIGLVASTGNKIASTSPARLYLTRKNVTDSISWLQEAYQSGLYYSRGVQDVSPGFQSGVTLLHSGYLSFLKESTRFNPLVMNFTIGVVPYPTADGEGGKVVTTTDVNEAISLGNNTYLTDNEGNYIKTVDMSDSSFQVPYTGIYCYSVTNINNGKNGITSEIATHILNDLVAGLGDDPDKVVNLSADDVYCNYLKERFDREIDIEVIMSCQGSTYFEVMELLSMTVGGGSNFGEGGFWPLAASMVKSTDSAVTALMEVFDKYKAAMQDLGYNVI